jgi:hypothetical protein
MVAAMYQYEKHRPTKDTPTKDTPSKDTPAKDIGQRNGIETSTIRTDIKI